MAADYTIRENFSSLSLEQVYGAIAYYLAHQAGIDSYLKTKHEDFEKARRSQNARFEWVAGALVERMTDVEDRHNLATEREIYAVFVAGGSE